MAPPHAFPMRKRAMLPVALAANLREQRPVAAVLRGSKGKHEELGPTLVDFTAEGVPVQASTEVAAAAAAPIPWVHDVNGSAHVAAAHGRVLATLALMAKHLKVPFLMERTADWTRASQLVLSQRLAQRQVPASAA